MRVAITKVHKSDSRQEMSWKEYRYIMDGKAIAVYSKKMWNDDPLDFVSGWKMEETLERVWDKDDPNTPEHVKMYAENLVNN